MTPRDEYGDKITAAQVEHEHEARDADRKSNRPTRATSPKTSGGARPMWADQWPAEWSS